MVFPTVERCIQGQERFDPALGKVRGHAFFVMRIGVGRKPVRGKLRSCGRSSPLPFSCWILLSGSQTRLHDFRFPWSEASLAPLSEVCLELSYLGVITHVLYCTYPATAVAVRGLPLSFSWLGLRASWGLPFWPFPAREPESGLPSRIRTHRHAANEHAVNGHAVNDLRLRRRPPPVPAAAANWIV